MLRDISKYPYDKKHKCKIFYCDHRRDRYCCFYCGSKDFCQNPCFNNPEKCGKALNRRINETRIQTNRMLFFD